MSPNPLSHDSLERTHVALCCSVSPCVVVCCSVLYSRLRHRADSRSRIPYSPTLFRTRYKPEGETENKRGHLLHRWRRLIFFLSKFAIPPSKLVQTSRTNLVLVQMSARILVIAAILMSDLIRERTRNLRFFRKNDIQISNVTHLLVPRRVLLHTVMQYAEKSPGPRGFYTEP